MADDKQGAFSGLKSAWGNPKARKGLLITAGIGGAVLVVTSMAMRGGNQPASGVPAAAAVAPPPQVRPDVTAQVTPGYQQMIKDRDAQRAQAASNSQLEMALPQVAGLTPVKEEGLISARPSPAPGGVQVSVSAPAGTSNQPTQGGQVQVSTPNQQQAQQQAEQQIRSNPGYLMTGAFLTSVAQATNYAKSSGFGIVRAADARGGAAGQSGQAGQTAEGSQHGAQAGAAAQKSPTPANVLIRAGTAVFATMDTAINSDFSGPVVATIRQGQFANAKLIGAKSLEYDAVVVRFNSISMPNGGPAIPIAAYAINLGDVNKFGTTGMDGSVDFHVFQRYLIPAVLAFTQTYGYAASVQGTSTTTGMTSTTQSTTPLSERDRMIVALGGAVAPIAADMAKRAARPVTVTMPANTEIGILFGADVTDKTAEKAASQAAQGINAGYESPQAGVQQARQVGTSNANPPPSSISSRNAMYPNYTAPYSSSNPVHNGQQPVSRNSEGQ